MDLLFAKLMLVWSIGASNIIEQRSELTVVNLLVNANFSQKCVNEWWNAKMGLFEFQSVCKSLFIWAGVPSCIREVSLKILVFLVNGRSDTRCEPF